ncbi:MAG: hypothetical protein WD355_02280 [Balneolaceae bacterium]
MKFGKEAPVYGTEQRLLLVEYVMPQDVAMKVSVVPQDVVMIMYAVDSGVNPAQRVRRMYAVPLKPEPEGIAWARSRGLAGLVSVAHRGLAAEAAEAAVVTSSLVMHTGV